MGTGAMTVAEVAERVGMSRRTIYRQLKATGALFGIPAHMERGHWRFQRKEVDTKFPVSKFPVSSSEVSA